jgi:anaerobic selenocysteine-containing dehydrogenase/Fe-S-cluster-containing dehydrogenase component
MTDGMNRRKFLKVLGVTGGGAAAMAGCSTERVEKLIPYLVPIEDQIPGLATYYASTCRECPAGCGVHLRVREGRAVKVEGNPDHPVNRGRLCARAQASLQGTYNPDRIRSPMARTPAGAFAPITWDEAIARVAERLKGAPAGSLWFLTGTETGSFDRLVGDWLRALGSSHTVTFEPFGHEALRQANRAAFGVDTIPSYRFADAECVVSFGADFLETWLSPVEHARGFAASHGYHDGRMGRYVHVEPRLSMTAMSADEWIAPVPGTEGMLALAMAHVIVNHHLERAPADAVQLRGLLQPYEPDQVAERTGVSGETIHRLAAEFAARPSLALPGGVGSQHQDARLTAVAVNLLNYVAGNVGRTVVFGPDGSAGGSSYAGLVDLVAAARRNEIGVLFVHGANPAYATPPGLGFGEAIAAVPFKVSFARCLDETAALADLLLPDHDPYEQWNDYTPRAGVWSLLQPVMRPVFDTRQAGDVLIDIARRVGGAAATRFALGGAQQELYKAYLQERWRELQRETGDRRPFDEFWREAVERGGMWRDARAAPVRVTRGLVLDPPAPAAGARFTAIVYPSSTLYDGRGANRPWLQELPDPVTKMTWGTWVELHPETAAGLGLAEGDVVEVRSAAGAIEAPVYLYPGLRPDVVAVPLGQGHTAYGRYADGRGVNALRLLGHEPAAFGGVVHYADVTLTATGAHVVLAKTEGKNRQLDRGIAQAVTVAGIAEGGLQHKFHLPEAAPIPEREERILDEVAEKQREATTYGPYAFETSRWGLSIDLARCTGCSACVAACSAENNVPFVGSAQVAHGREMQWIRIERYFEGGGAGEPLEARFVPMLCQQCGNAPCEPVCPVFAAYHTSDGLNGQAYNRCVGTRYCSNNCPYKVRYFNWYDQSTPNDPKTFAWAEPLHWLLNPDVTVRSKGVMEKCTFCVQRIRGAQNAARVAGRDLVDGDIVTACQQTCPADAIVFGNLTDTGSRVARLAADPRRYRVLESLNTQPAVTYLMKVRNLGAEA